MNNCSNKQAQVGALYTQANTQKLPTEHPQMSVNTQNTVTNMIQPTTLHVDYNSWMFHQFQQNYWKMQRATMLRTFEATVPLCDGYSTASVYPSTSAVSYGPGPPIITSDKVKGPRGSNLFVFHLPNEITNW
jgi:hypothetical protein